MLLAVSARAPGGTSGGLQTHAQEPWAFRRRQPALDACLPPITVSQAETGVWRAEEVFSGRRPLPVQYPSFYRQKPRGKNSDRLWTPRATSCCKPIWAQLPGYWGAPEGRTVGQEGTAFAVWHTQGFASSGGQMKKSVKTSGKTSSAVRSYLQPRQLALAAGVCEGRSRGPRGAPSGKRLPSAQVTVAGSWGRAPRWTACSVGSLCALLRVYSLSNK